MVSVLFDGQCALCRASADRLRRADRRHALALLDLNDPAVLGRFPQVDAARARALMQAVDAQGRVFSGVDAWMLPPASCRAGAGCRRCCAYPAFMASPRASMRGSPATAIAGTVASALTAVAGSMPADASPAPRLQLPAQPHPWARLARHLLDPESAHRGHLWPRWIFLRILGLIFLSAF